MSDEALSEVRARHYVIVSPGLGNPVCVTCYSNLGKPRPWPCDVELIHRALDEFVEGYREALERLSAWGERGYSGPQDRGLEIAALLEERRP